MKVYNILDRMPVSLFFRPDFTIDTGLKKITGDFKLYKIGDKLNLNTLYYKYPKNFIVLNVSSMEACIVKDGEVKGVKTELTEDDIANAEKIYTPFGEELNIDYIDDVQSYKNSYEYLIEQYNLLKDKKNDILREIQSKIDEDDFIFIRLKPEMDKIDAKIVELQTEFDNTHIIINEERKAIEEFGMYIACLINKMNEFHIIKEVGLLLEEKKEVPAELLGKYKSIDIIDFEKSFNFLKDKFSEFLFKHKNLNHAYLKWLDLGNSELSEDYIKIVEDVILNIHDILEN